MATDRKADYVGDHGGTYTDLNGMSKQFTVVDHDKKTTIHFNSEKISFNMSEYRYQLIDRILELPASIFPERFRDYTVRGDTPVITWNETMLRNDGVPISQLRDLCVLCENKAELMRLIP